MPKFRKKPVVIEARQWSGDAIDVDEFIEWIMPWSIGLQGDRLVLFTLEGNMEANPGDYVIRGVAGEFYPIKPDIFAATYEPVEEE
jgi:hypothetical protein